VGEGQSPTRAPKPYAKQQLATRRGGLPDQPPPDHVVSDGGQRARIELYGTANNHYREINRSWTLTWLRHRMREYVNIHGYASSGVCSLLERAAEQYADADYLRATAASKGDPDPSALKQAGQHAANARSHELAAWELAAREGVMRRALTETDGKISSLANGLRSEAAKSKPGSWDGGLTAEGVDAGAIDLRGSQYTHGSEDTQSGGVPGSDVTQPPTFAPPGGVEGRGPLLASQEPPDNPPPHPIPSDTDSGRQDAPRSALADLGDPEPASEPSAPFVEPQAPAAEPPSPPEPKLPLYLYCEPCGRNFKVRGNALHCVRCGVAAELPPEAPPPAPPRPGPVTGTPWRKCGACGRHFRRSAARPACSHCGVMPAGEPESSLVAAPNPEPSLTESGESGTLTEREPE